MALNLLIADDEYFIRQRLKKIIPWTALNLNFIGEAENGMEVMELLEKHPVDIIILDIKMPKMTGIQAAEQIHEDYPQTKIIILSGYNDFEYARTAMRYGVTDYLLKPVDTLVLKSTLEDCIEKIALSKKQHRQIEKLNHYEKCTALTNVQNGSLDIQALYTNYPEFLQITHALYIGAFVFENTEVAVHRLITALRLEGFQCEYTQEAEYIYVLQIFFTARQASHHIGSVLTEFVEKEKHFVFLSVGNLFGLTESWNPYFKRVLHGLSQRYFSSGSNLLLEYAATREPDYSIDLPKIRQNITLHLNGKDEKTFSDYIEELFSSIEKKHSVDYLYLIVTELFMTFHIYYHILENTTTNINEFISSILDEEYTLESLKNTAIHYGLQCIQQNDTSPSDVALSKKLMSYIDEHYRNQDLSVAQIGDIFQLNPSYMGSVFKKVNDISILQYITNVRMEASKRLLESNQYKISEIAEQVGYSDVFYFSKRFKKSYGYSPKDYALRNKS